MKRRFIYVLVFLMMISILIGCSKKNEDLVKIVDMFNSSDTVKTYKGYGYDLKATTSDNEIVVTYKFGETNSSVTFKLEGNILSNEALKDEDLMVTALLIDSVAQVNGYKEGELIDNFNAFPDEVSKYTIDKEGYELKTNGNTSSFKMDITRQVPLIDLSGFYLKPSQFDMIAEIVSENSVGNETGAVSKLSYDIVIRDDKSEIYIGEKEKLTDSAYKSILSALQVMYGPEVVENFKSLYPSFKSEKTTVGAFTIETNYKMEDEEEGSIFNGRKVVLVTIDNQKVKK